MANQKQITAGLKAIGAAWATADYKYACTDYNCCNHLTGNKAAYHVHPDASYLHLQSIRKFYNLKEVWAYVQARQASIKAADDYAAGFDCPTPQECESINEEANARAARVMEDFWANLA